MGGGLGIFIIKSTCVMIFCGATGAHMRRMMERGKQKAHPERADLRGKRGERVAFNIRARRE